MKGGESEEMREQICQKGGGEGRAGGEGPTQPPQAWPGTAFLEAQSGRWGSSDIRTPGQDLVRPSLECFGAASHLCHRLLPLCPHLCPQECKDSGSSLPQRLLGPICSH